MDILELIAQDHRKVEQLFTQIETAKGKKLYDCFTQIYKELNLHSEAEELVFYPAMRDFAELEDMLEEAEAEHDEVKVMLEQLKEMETSEPQFMEMIMNLKDAVQHHVEEEESEIFAAVRENMDSATLQDWAEEFTQAKARVQEDIEIAISG